MELYVNSDEVRGDHLNAEVTGINDDIYANVEAFKPETRDEAGQQTSNGKRCWALGLGTLGLLLLFGIMGLSVHYIIVVSNHQSEMQNLQSDYENLTAAQKQLRTNYKNLTKVGDKLQTSYDTLTKERDALTQERNQLQGNYETLRTELDVLTKERDQLKATSNNLMTEKDQLQSRFDTVSASRDALQREVDLQNCPQGWEKFGCSCYYVSSESKTWSESRDDCANKGAHLVIINSKEEQVFLNKFAVRAWIGLSDREDEGKWKWVDGSPLVGEAFWRKGEPNDHSGNEDCVEVTGEEYQWNDLLCTVKQSWICENVITN